MEYKCQYIVGLTEPNDFLTFIEKVGYEIGNKLHFMWDLKKLNW